MKNAIFTFIMGMIALSCFAQHPQAFKYHAVVRDNSGDILQNQEVGIRISIHDATAGGTIVYQKTLLKLPMILDW